MFLRKRYYLGRIHQRLRVRIWIVDMFKVNIRKFDGVRFKVFIECITHIMYFSVYFKQIDIFGNTLLDESDSSESGVNVVVADYSCEKWKYIGF